MDTLVQDFRQAVRGLRRTPGVTSIIVLTLGLGIGANSALFGLLDAALFRPPAVREPHRLVLVEMLMPRGEYSSNFSYADYRDWRDRNTVLSGIAAFGFSTVTLRTEAGSERVWGQQVSGNYFDVMGARPLVGRALEPADDMAAAPPAIMLSHRLWRSRFAADPGVLGASVTLDGRPFTVVGVGPRGFQGPTRGFTPDFWIPITHAVALRDRADMLESRDMHWLSAIGRLAPGVPIAAATAQLRTLHRRLSIEHPPHVPDGATAFVSDVRLAPGARGDVALLRDVVRIGSVLILVTGLVLLIACANVANLLLARASARAREISVRLALGATRGRLVRYLLCESVVLGAVGGAAGLLVAWWSTELLASFRPPSFLPLDLDVRLDGRVLLVTAATSLVTALAFGLVPALRASRADLTPALKSGAGATGGATRSRLRGALVVAQVALSMVVLVGAGLFARSLGNEQDIDLGYDPRGAVAFSLDPGRDGASALAFYRELLERVRHLPGVTSAAIVEYVTPSPGGNSISGMRYEFGLPGDGPFEFDLNVVSPGYFQALGVPLLRGREFRDGDIDFAHSFPGVIVNETMARTLWPGQDPIGRMFRVDGEESPPVPIIGVAKDGRYRSLREAPRPYLYLAMDAWPLRQMNLVVRSDGPSSTLIAAVRRTVQGMDGGVPLYNVRTLEEHVATALLPSRFAAYLLGVFGALALVLASLGLYGVLSYSVVRRQREIGVRVALGARPGDVLAQFVGEGLRMSVFGLALGVALALAATPLAASFLYRVRPHDPGTYVAVAVALVGVAAFACWLPARRAARVEPMRVLRSE